jgi:succinyl-diaminopimelate desuccinylase
MPERGDNAFYKLAKGALLMEQFQFDTPPHDLMGQGTLNVGTAKAGLNINSVPDAAEMTLDIRTVPGQSHKHIYGCLCKVLGPQYQTRNHHGCRRNLYPARPPLDQNRLCSVPGN